MSEMEERIGRYEVRDKGGVWASEGDTREEAERLAAEDDAEYPGTAPHRVVHLVELRPGERIVSEEEG